MRKRGRTEKGEREKLGQITRDLLPCWREPVGGTRGKNSGVFPRVGRREKRREGEEGEADA